MKIIPSTTHLIVFALNEGKILHFISVSDIISLKKCFTGALNNMVNNLSVICPLLFYFHSTLSSSEFDFAFPLKIQRACLKNCTVTKLLKMEQAIK